MKPYILEDDERIQRSNGLPKQMRKAVSKKKKMSRRDKRRVDRKALQDQLEQGDWT